MLLSTKTAERSRRGRNLKRKSDAPPRVHIDGGGGGGNKEEQTTEKKKKSRALVRSKPRRIRRVRRKNRTAEDTLAAEMRRMSLLQSNEKNGNLVKLFLGGLLSDKKRESLSRRMQTDALSFMDHPALTAEQRTRHKRAFISQCDLSTIVDWPIGKDMLWEHFSKHSNEYPMMCDMVKSDKLVRKFDLYVKRYGVVMAAAMLEAVATVLCTTDKKKLIRVASSATGALTVFKIDLEKAFFILMQRNIKEPAAKEPAADLLGTTIGRVVYLIENISFGLAYVACLSKQKHMFEIYQKERKKWRDIIQRVKGTGLVVKLMDEFPNNAHKLRAMFYSRCRTHIKSLALIRA